MPDQLSTASVILTEVVDSKKQAVSGKIQRRAEEFYSQILDKEIFMHID